MAEKCSSCESMKKGNAQLRRALMDTNKGYVEVCNEVLALKRELEETRSIAFPLSTIPLKLKDPDQCDPLPVPLVADPALITYPKIESGPSPSHIWKNFIESLKQEKDKWK